jgi:hypothetical protein
MAILGAALLAAALALAATDPEAHMNDPAGALCSRSAFAHGYLHGYFEGFHNADLDIHMGRAARPKGPRKPEHADKEIPSSDPASFHKGYSKGYEAGYNDGISGREFRAIAELRAVAADLAAAAGGPASFDRGFASGYASGRQYTSEHEAPIYDFHYVLGFCLASMTDNPGPGYCDAYTRGFRLGYDDGALQRPQTMTARNDEK